MAEVKEMEELSGGSESKVKGWSHVLRNVTGTDWKANKGPQKDEGVIRGIGDESERYAEVSLKPEKTEFQEVGG